MKKKNNSEEKPKKIDKAEEVEGDEGLTVKEKPEEEAEEIALPPIEHEAMNGEDEDDEFPPVKKPDDDEEENYNPLEDYESDSGY